MCFGFSTRFCPFDSPLPLICHCPAHIIIGWAIQLKNSAALAAILNGGEAAGCYLKPQLSFQQNGIIIRIRITMFTNEIQVEAVAEFPLDA